jgi:spore germination protein (amino acid permease)
MATQIGSSNQVNGFMLFFIIHSSQVGIGILTFQKALVEKAGYDSWIGILAGGLMTHFSLFCIYWMLKDKQHDIEAIHRFIYGKWIGKFFTLFFIAQYVWSALTILRVYIRVLEVWMFPGIPTWFPTLLILLLIYYAVSGGFRVIVGLCFFEVMMSLWIVVTLFFPLKYANFGNLSLIPTHSFSEIWAATQIMAFSYIGFETVLVYYPFIKDGQRSRVYAYLGNAVTVLLYLFVTLICFVFFSEEQLTRTIWPYLTVAKVISFSMIQRVEFVIISLWVLVVIPNLILYLWCASRLAKQLFKVKQKYPLFLFMAIVLAVSQIVEDSQDFDMLSRMNGEFSFYINYVYIPLLFLLYLAVRKWKTSTESS